MWSINVLILGIHSFLFTVLYHLINGESNTRVDYQYLSYVRNVNTQNIDPSIIPTRYTSSNRIECAHLCGISKNNCTSFLWNSVSKTCTVELDWIMNSDLDDGGDDELYMTSNSCPYNLGYELRVTGNGVKMCLFLAATMAADHDQAQYFCSVAGGRLAKVNTVDKKSAVKQLIQDKTRPDILYYTIAIGFSDRDQEGVYVWSDGLLMTSDELTNMFNLNQPDNSQGIENCGEMRQPFNYSLNDIRCDQPTYYLCEIGVA